MLLTIFQFAVYIIRCNYRFKQQQIETVIINISKHTDQVLILYDGCFGFFSLSLSLAVADAVFAHFVVVIVVHDQPYTVYFWSVRTLPHVCASTQTEQREKLPSRLAATHL